MPTMWADDGTGIPECRERPLPLGSPPQTTSDDLRRRSHRQPALDLGPARRAGCTMPCLPVRSVRLPWLTTRLADMPLADSGMSVRLASRLRGYRGPAKADLRGASQGCLCRVEAHWGIDRERPSARQRLARERDVDTPGVELDRDPGSACSPRLVRGQHRIRLAPRNRFRSRRRRFQPGY